MVAEPAKAPAISVELQAEYYRADSVLAHLKPVGWEEAQADLMKAVAAIQTACGEKFMPSLDNKKLVCIPKPEPPKEAPKK